MYNKQKPEARSQNAGDFFIYDLLFTIVPAFAGMTILFLCGLCAFVAQTTVLIGVYSWLIPCRIEKNSSKKAKRRVNLVFIRNNSWLI